MKISKIKQKIVCDTVLCGEIATYCIESESYKGNIYLCEKCFKSLQNNLKRINFKDEKK